MAVAFAGDHFAEDPSLFRAFPAAPKPIVAFGDIGRSLVVHDRPVEMLADNAGRVWIRTLRPRSSGAVYYVASPQARAVQVCVLPTGTIVGFGNGGRVYLAIRDSEAYRLAVAPASEIVPAVR